MPKPFPAPISIGTDICHIPRILNIITKEHGRKASRFVSKILTNDEIIASKDRLGALDFLGIPRKPHPAELAESYKNPDAADQKKIHPPMTQAERDRTVNKMAVFLAGRFAAKEAAIKAHRKRRLGFHDIVIKPGPLEDDRPTAPTAVVRPWNPGSEWEEVMLSISHDGAYAIASVLAAEGLEGPALLKNWHMRMGQPEGREKTAGLTDEGKGVWSVFVGNIPVEASETDLKTAFERFGVVDQAIVARRKDGQHVGYGFVSFKDKSAAEDAINYNKEIYILGWEVYTSPKKPGQEAKRPGEAIMQALGFGTNRNKDQSTEFNIDPSKGAYSVFVKHLTRFTTESDLTMAFGYLPSFMRAVVSRLRDGRSLGYGFVAFGSLEDANVMMELDKKVQVNGSLLGVGRSYVNSKMIVSARENGSVSLISELEAERDNSVALEFDDDQMRLSPGGGVLRLNYLKMSFEERKRRQAEEVEFWIKAQEILRTP